MNYETLQEQFLHNNKIKIGDKVTVFCSAVDRERGWCNSWVSHMDGFIGKECEVMGWGYGGVSLYSSDLGSYGFPYFVIRRHKRKIG